jgi:predicted membrane protein (TIGR00267 family)
MVRNIRQTLRRDDVGPIVRRLFINTLFDSTFMLLGIVVGAAFVANGSLRIILGTMVASSFALGISTGVSVYEAESLERKRKISELERALFRDLTGTRIERSARFITTLIALINFSTPLVACVVATVPFLLAATGILEVRMASWLSVACSLGTLFFAGTYLGRLGKQNPLTKGLRMVGFGSLAFIVGYLLNVLV